MTGVVSPRLEIEVAVVFDLYMWGTPNGWKASIAMEELQLPYVVKLIDIGRGVQRSPEYVRINPNGRIPALVDRDPALPEPVVVFESGAILIYLAEKTGHLLPRNGPARQRVMSWLMWQMSGFGPMLGQHGHFKIYADEIVPYAADRYEREARRLYGVLDGQLAYGAFVAGEFSIADIAIFPWAMTHKAQGFSLDDWPNVKRWYALVRQRDAVQRGIAVGRAERKGELDGEARRSLFGGASSES